MEKVKMILNQISIPKRFKIQSSVIPLKNQKDQEEDTTSQKINVVKQNVFIEYRKIVTDRFIKRMKSFGATSQTVIALHKKRTCLPSLKIKIENNLKIRLVYKIVCPGYNACYVDQISRYLTT